MTQTTLDYVFATLRQDFTRQCACTVVIRHPQRAHTSRDAFVWLIRQRQAHNPCHHTPIRFLLIRSSDRMCNSGRLFSQDRLLTMAASNRLVSLQHRVVP